MTATIAHREIVEIKGEVDSVLRGEIYKLIAHRCSLFPALRFFNQAIVSDGNICDRGRGRERLHATRSVGQVW